MSDDTPNILPTPDTVAYVSLRADEILVVEDLMGETEGWHIGSGLPRRTPIGSVLTLAHAPRPCRVGLLRDEVLRLVTEAGDGFLTFPWVDPDGRRSG